MTRLYPSSAFEPLPDPGNYYQSTIPFPLAPLPLQGDQTTEVAIIGAGFTGLSAALQLAENHAVKATVLDAAFPGWGASGRNGGFACLGGSKVEGPEMLRRFGEAETRRFYTYQDQAIDQVAANLQTYAIDADTHSDGEWAFAHRPRDMADLEAYAAAIRKYRGKPARTVTQDELRDLGMFSPEFHGGMHLPMGFALNPLKYVLGLARAAESAGVTIHAHSPVTAITRQNTGWRLTSPQGSLTAKKLIIATNGYTDDAVPGAMGGTFLPVLSNILVTRPMSDGELKSQGWTATNTAYDTRHLLHYWRLMPGGRMLFGLRGGTGFTQADRARSHQIARRDFDRFFPAWREVETPYFWSGLVCLTRDRLMKAGPVTGMDNAFAVIGCQGSGVTMCSLTGRRIADLAMGAITQADLPAQLTTPLRRFPMPGLRLAYLKAAYFWYSWLDA